jgi:hypothetical protein
MYSEATTRERNRAVQSGTLRDSNGLECIGIISEFVTLTRGETGAEALVRGHTKEKLSLR